MSRLTADQLAERLISAAEEAFPKVDAIEIIVIATEMLFLKRAADQPWTYEIGDSEPLASIARSSDPDRRLSELLNEVAHRNGRIINIPPLALDIASNLKPVQMRRFADSLSHISLGDDSLEFPDTVGAAYDRFLAHLMDMAGKLGGSISTPDSVTELMIQISSPSAGESVCDPFAGLGGFLTLAHDYVRETQGDNAEVNLFGQEINSSIWILAKLNLLLRGIVNCEFLEGDTLERPALKWGDGGLMVFDRVLTHAPFSLDYERRHMHYQERMRYGWPSEHGRADLLVVQHVLASLAHGGRGVVLAPLGVLFRSGPEAEIRRGMIEDGRIDAVISLGPNILPSTGIPACVLILRGQGGLRFERPEDVMFINAESELTRSRGINRLGPEAIEKIVSVFHDRADVPGFSRVISAAEIEANDFNLSVRPYTDRGVALEEPADATAIISGGVPCGEVAAAADPFTAFGIDPVTLFLPRNSSRVLGETSSHLHFYEEGYEATAAEIGSLADRREDEFAGYSQAWWNQARIRLAGLAEERRLLRSRPHLINWFASELMPVGLLDKYQLRGAFATWWSAWHDDLRVMEHYGFQAVLDRWLASGAARAHSVRGDPADGVLDILGTDLVTRTQAMVVAERQKLVDIYLSWGERYGTSLLQLEAEAADARVRLEDRLRALGYGDPLEW